MFISLYAGSRRGRPHLWIFYHETGGECRLAQSSTRLKTATRPSASRGPCKLKLIERDIVVSYREDENRKAMRWQKKRVSSSR